MVIKVILKTNNHGLEKIKDPLAYNHDLQFSDYEISKKWNQSEVKNSNNYPTFVYPVFAYFLPI